MVTTTARTKTAKRGIEPIVAAILLIAIAIVAGVILYLWVSRLISSGTTTTTASVAAQMQVLSVEGLCTSQSCTVTIYVRSPNPLLSTYIREAVLYFVNGTVAKVVSKECTKSSTEPCIEVSSVSGDVYKIVVKNLDTKYEGGTYYCEVFTSYGTFVTPSFIMS